MDLRAALLLLILHYGYTQGVMGNSEAGPVFGNGNQHLAQYPVRELASIGKSKILECDINYPGGQWIESIIQWRKQGIEVPIFIQFDGYPPHIDAGYQGRIRLVEQASIEISDIRKTDDGWYECTVVFLDGNDDSDTNGTWINLVVVSVPGSLESVRVVKVKQTSVTLEVQAPASDGGSEITAYSFEYDGSVTYEYPADQTNNTFMYTIENMKPSTSYSISVRAQNIIGNGPATKLSVTTDFMRRPDRVEITSSPQGSEPDSYLLTWNTPDDGGKPIFYYSITYHPVGSDDFEMRLVGEHASAPVTSHLLTWLQPNTEYSVSILAASGMGNSEPSKEFTFRTTIEEEITSTLPPTTQPPLGLPGSLESVRVVKVKQTSVTLEVQAPASDGGSEITAYSFEYDGSVTYEYPADQTNNTFRYTITDLKPSTFYIISVLAQNIIGKGPSTQISVTTDSMRRPGQVEITSSPEGAEPDSYLLTWNTPDDGGKPIYYYSIKYRPVGSDDFQMFLVGENHLSPVTSHLLTYEVQPNTRYSVSILAASSMGNSEPSKEFIFRTASEEVGHDLARRLAELEP